MTPETSTPPPVHPLGDRPTPSLPTRDQLFRSYLDGLSRGERWSHCGSSRVHGAHTHTVCFTGETPNPGVPCVGTPDLLAEERARDLRVFVSQLNLLLRRAGLEYPLGLEGVRDLVRQRDGQRERAEAAEDLLRELRPLVLALTTVQSGALLRELNEVLADGG